MWDGAFLETCVEWFLRMWCPCVTSTDEKIDRTEVIASSVAPRSFQSVVSVILGSFGAFCNEILYLSSRCAGHDDRGLPSHG